MIRGGLSLEETSGLYPIPLTVLTAAVLVAADVVCDEPEAEVEVAAAVVGCTGSAPVLELEAISVSVHVEI